MREARQTHVEWVEHFESCRRPNCDDCKEGAEVAGDAKHHREWVKKYDRVLKILEGL